MNDSNPDPSTAIEVSDPSNVVGHAAALTIIIGIMLAMFLSALEQTIVAPALPTIGRVLGDAENLSWVVTAYLISATVATPLFGKLSDIYGRRRMMLVSISVFILGSVACAVAPTMPLLIAGRALQGFGGGGLLPLAQTVIADLFSPRERPVVQAYSSTMFMTASIVGPILGGFFTDHLHWSLIFWINLPLGAVALIMSDRVLRRLPRNDRRHALDLVGAALMVGATIVLLAALSWGGVRYPWISLPIAFLFGASALLWIGFWWRLIRAPEPFIPLSMLREPVVCGIVIAGFFSIGTIIGLSIFVPLYVELVLGLSASASGVVLIGFMGGATVGSMVAGRLIARMEHYKRVPVIAAPLAIVVFVLLAVWPSGWSLVAVAVLMTLAGVGMGPMYPATTVIIQNAVPAHQFGIATGTLNFFRSLGGAIIVATFAAVVLAGFADSVLGRTLDKLANAGSSTGELAQQFRLVFAAAAIFLGLACIAVAVIEERPMRGPHVRSRELQ